MKVSIEKQSDGSYIAYNTTGDKVQLIGTGDSVKEVKEDFFNSLDEVLSRTMKSEMISPNFLTKKLNSALTSHRSLNITRCSMSAPSLAISALTTASCVNIAPAPLKSPTSSSKRLRQVFTASAQNWPLFVLFDLALHFISRVAAPSPIKARVFCLCSVKFA